MRGDRISPERKGVVHLGRQIKAAGWMEVMIPLDCLQVESYRRTFVGGRASPLVFERQYLSYYEGGVFS